MRVFVVVGVLAILLSGCATTNASTPASLTAILQLQMKQRAGIYPVDNWIVRGESHEAQYDRLVEWAEHKGIVVALAALDKRNLRGSLQPGYGGWVVLIHQELGANAKFYTLLHELAHLYGPTSPSELDREVIAEIIAAMVCERVGLNVWPQTAGYLASRVPSLETQAAAVQRCGAAIDRLVNALVRVVEKPKQP